MTKVITSKGLLAIVSRFIDNSSGNASGGILIIRPRDKVADDRILRALRRKSITLEKKGYDTRLNDTRLRTCLVLGVPSDPTKSPYLVRARSEEVAIADRYAIVPLEESWIVDAIITCEDNLTKGGDL